MADRSKAFEAFVALLGLALTGVLGYGQYSLSKEQTEQSNQQRLAEKKRGVDNLEVQVMTLVAPHLINLAKPGADFLPSQRVVLAASEYLSNQHQRTALATMSAKISEGNASVSNEVATRLKEASQVSQDVLSGTRWFAVVATLPSDSEPAARTAADQWLARARAKDGKATIGLYKTKISNSYAIVLGSGVSQTQAGELARQARDWKLAPDAFAQQDRGWTLVGTAPFN